MEHSTSPISSITLYEATRTIQVILTPAIDPMPQARLIFERGVGSTNDLGVLTCLHSLCEEAGCEMDVIRKFEANLPTGFDRREAAY